MEMLVQHAASRKTGPGTEAGTIACPTPLEGIGSALRAVFDRATIELPEDFQTLLEQIH